MMAAGREVIDTSDLSDTSDVPDRLGAFDDVLDAPDGMPAPVGAMDDAVVGRDWFDDGLGAVSAPLDGLDGPVDAGDLEDLPHQGSGFDAFGQ